MSPSPADDDDLIRIGELPPEPVHLTRIGEVPQVSDFDRDDIPVFGEHLDGVKIISLGEDEPLPDLLPPAGKSQAEVEAEYTPEMVQSKVVLDRLRERITSKPPPEEAPTFRFTLTEGFVFLTAMAIGLAVGRIDSSGVFALFLGFGVTIALIQIFFFQKNERIWIIVAVTAVSLYLGATLGTAAMRWIASPTT